MKNTQGDLWISEVNQQIQEQALANGQAENGMVKGHNEVLQFIKESIT